MDMINCMISDNYYVLGCFVKDREVEINKQFLELPSSVHSDSIINLGEWKILLTAGSFNGPVVLSWWEYCSWVGSVVGPKTPLSQY